MLILNSFDKFYRFSDKRKYILTFFLKKKLRNNSTIFIKINKLSLLRVDSFYLYIKPFRILFKQKYHLFLFKWFKWFDYLTSRDFKKLSSVRGYYGGVFWFWLVFPLFLMNLGIFKKIFTNLFQKEKSTFYVKLFKFNHNCAFSSKLEWNYDGWEFFDVNGINKYLNWCWGKYKLHFYETLDFIEEQKLSNSNMFDLTINWLESVDHVLETIKFRRIYNYKEFIDNQYVNWYSFFEKKDVDFFLHVNAMAFPYSQIPVDCWFALLY